MVRSYLLLTLRNFLRNKNYTLINLLGLSIGITSCLILFLIIRYDLNFDKFHAKYESIYRIVQESTSSSGTEFSSATPYPVIKGFRNDFPDVPLTTQMHFEGECIVRINESKFKVEDLLFADSLFFDVFDFETLSGNPREELAEPGKAFVTPAVAHQIGYQVNTPLRVKINNLIEVEVVGLVQEPPATSHIQYSMIVSMSSFTGDFIGGMPIDTWNLTSAGFSYIVLPESMSPGTIDERMKGFVEKYYSKNEGKDRAYKLQQLKDIHFDEKFNENPTNTANVSYADLLVMGILGAFILVIACINFINLSTALAIKKSKEIGIRKTLGAKRSQLTFYFLGETFLLTLFAVLISLGLAEWILPWLNHFLEKKISLDLFADPMLMLFILGMVLSTTVLSGFYPALILSGFNPVAVLKNKITAQGSTSAEVRKVLVVFQFMIAQCLIIGTLVIAGQMDYFRNKNLGFDKDAVIGVSMPDNKKETLESFRARLESNANISNISFSIGAPTSTNNFGTGYFLSEADSKEVFVVSVKPVDRHYLDTYGIKLVAGRWFTESDEKQADPLLPQDEQEHVYILNESAVKQLGFNKPEDILGKSVTTGVNRIKSEVVGVVNDFHVSSLHDEIKPVILMNFPEFYYEAGIKVNAGQLRETVEYIEAQWTKLYPDSYFEYFFLDEELAKLYRQDERTFTLFKIFAAVSIFIGCLGLYGLISFMANQKLKEVGIRKVMGASVTSIVLLFSKDFIRLIIIAFLIAAPLAWYFMNQWLQGFAYHIDIHWSVFVISIVSTLCIALLTVSYRSIRAAVSNPSETLRTE